MRRWLRRLALGGLVLLIVGGVALAAWVRAALPAVTGLAAKQLCSVVHVSGLDVDRARRLYVDGLLGPLPPILEARAEGDRLIVRAPGGIEAAARHRAGYGCTLEAEGVDLAPGRRFHDRPPLVDVLDAAHRDAHFDVAALHAAVDATFGAPGDGRNTLAVVVHHRDALVAERYAEGIDARTPLPGWSMAKSVTATLISLAVQDDLLDVNAPGAVAEWRERDDPRGAITLDHLLTMTSGLDLPEAYTGVHFVTDMLFRTPDAAALAARRALEHEPGDDWAYQSGSTVLAARALRAVTGETLEAHFAWMHQRLFAPLAMYSATPEPDPSGTFVGSSFMLATGQDWARLGGLHARGGTLADGTPFLDPAWIAYVATPTPKASWGYGAGFWLNRTVDGVRDADRPADTRVMNGFQGQYVVVIPSRELVLVRLGASHGWDHGVDGLVQGVLRALEAR